MGPSERRGEPGGALVAPLLRFAAVLRRLGLPVGTGQALDAVRALSAIDLARRDDVYVALRAVLLDAHAHEGAFVAAFDRFWNGLQPFFEAYGAAIDGALAAASGNRRPRPVGTGQEGQQRTTEKQLTVLLAGEADEEAGEDEALDDAGEAQAVAYSAAEALRHKDFADLTTDELAEMRRLLSGLTFRPPRRRLRRTESAPHGSLLDLRRVARRNLRYGGEIVTLPRRRRRERARPLVLICDVSGSMDRYTRLLLRFLHAAMQGLVDVETFVFGTRLTRITHQLRTRDPDRALDEVAHEVQDFAGGTRIGASLSAFNRHWARRSLGGGAIAVIISDGWDRGDPATLAAEMAHLHRSCHLLVWLNPLLGLDGYQPPTRGMSAALPHIDLFLPSHNLSSLESLALLLSRISATSSRQEPRPLGTTGRRGRDGLYRR